MSQEYVKKRIEQIVEEHKQQVGTAPGTPISVIVQMETGENLQGFLEASVEAIAMRRSVSSARSLIPPRHEVLRESAGGGAKAASAKRHLSRSAAVSAESFLANLKSPSAEDLETIGRSALKPLMDSDWVKDRVASTTRGRSDPRKGLERSVSHPTPVHFLASGSRRT